MSFKEKIISSQQIKFIKKIFDKKSVKHLSASIAIIVLSPIIAIWFLDFFTNHGQALSVPDFTGLTIKEAEILADEVGVKVKIIDSVYDAQGKKRGTVINQNPLRDFKVKKNRHIFVTIKSLKPGMIKMPDFKDMTFIQAKADIETYGLRIEKLEYMPSEYDNVVLEQRLNGKPIRAGADIERGSKIILVLGRSEDMEEIVTPMLIGLTKSEALQEMGDKMLNIGEIVYDETIISSQDSLNAKINKQYPVVNVPIKQGEEIDIYLSMLGDTIY